MPDSVLNFKFKVYIKPQLTALIPFDIRIVLYTTPNLILQISKDYFIPKSTCVTFNLCCHAKVLPNLKVNGKRLMQDNTFYKHKSFEKYPLIFLESIPRLYQNVGRILLNNNHLQGSFQFDIKLDLKLKWSKIIFTISPYNT